MFAYAHTVHMYAYAYFQARALGLVSQTAKTRQSKRAAKPGHGILEANRKVFIPYHISLVNVVSGASSDLLL